MDTKFLTISIVTADRTCIYQCLDRLKLLPGIEDVIVNVFDNSKDKFISDALKAHCKLLGFSYIYDKSFLMCRNLSVSYLTTDYMMILDDDDYLSVDALHKIRESIELFPNADFISYDIVKEGRLEPHSNNCEVVSGGYAKLKLLNNFDSYEFDRLTKVYLSNCGNIYHKSLLSQVTWKYVYCDDILPVTSMYLKAKQVVRIGQPLYYYTVQDLSKNPATGDKLTFLDANMKLSYEELIEEFGDSFFNRLILKKCINNSIRQLKVINNLDSTLLTKLKTSIKLIKL